MAYEVTATRKRPKDFNHLVGQEFVVSTLKNSVKSGRIAHAYLFAGPRGVGKTSAARILAKVLNCPDLSQIDACDDWEGAEEIARGRSIDVIEIDGASNTSVSDIRLIKDEVLFPPQSSRYKIYIIDEVHMLSNSAFNALLKTIEEPPPYIIFIFATTELHKVPATIRSRCQQFVFKLIPLELIKERLSEAALDLGVKADDEALFWIAKESTGSMRDAYTLFDQVVAFSEGQISIEKIHEKLGLIGLDQLNELASLILSGAAGQSLEYIHAIFSSGIAVEQFLIDICEYYRGVLFLKVGVKREALLGYSSERFLAQAVEVYSRTQIEKILSLILSAYRDVRYSVDPRYDVELLMARLCRIRSFLEPEELYERLRALELNGLSIGDTGTKPSAAKPLSNPKSEVAISPQKIQAPSDQGPRTLSAHEQELLVQILRRDHLTIGSALDHVMSWELDDGVLLLETDHEYSAESLQRIEHALVLACKGVVDGVSSLKVIVHEKKISTKDEHASHLANDHSPEAEKIREIFKGEYVKKAQL